MNNIITGGNSQEIALDPAVYAKLTSASAFGIPN